MKKKEIKLSAEEKKEITVFCKTGVHSAKLIKRGEIILLLNTTETGKAVSFKEISRRLDVSTTTITNVKKDYFAAKDIETFLQRKKREKPPIEPKITGDVEARIIALACSKAPEGCARWTVRLIAEKSVELQIVNSLSFKSVQRLLKKRNLSLT